MDDEINLPFKEGQLVESRSFEKGFRGAWFKCKIINISRKRGRLGSVLEYLDFPGEKLKWRMLYHVTHDGDLKEKHRELLLRPPYPPLYSEEQMPLVSEISEVAVIVGDSWKVGDLVDWWTTGCYWSGRITQLLGSNKAQMALHPPPLGEGDIYIVHFKDLRPTLDWSPELGWTIPTQEGADRPCARLIKPTNEGREAEGVQRSNEVKSQITETQAQSLSENRKNRQERSSGSPRKTSLVEQKTAEAKSRTTETQTEPVSEKQKGRLERSFGQGPVDSGRNRNLVKSRREETDMQNKQESSAGQPRKRSRVAGDSGQNGGEPAAAEDKRSGPTLNSKRSDTLEAAIVDLEEYVNKVKWLKKVLQNGISSSYDERPQWTFS